MGQRKVHRQEECNYILEKLKESLGGKNREFRQKPKIV